MAGLKDEEYKTKSCQREFIHGGMRIKKKLYDADSSTKSNFIHEKEAPEKEVDSSTATKSEGRTDVKSKTRYHNSASQEIIRHGPKELSKNLFAACYVQGSGAHYPGPTHLTPRRNNARQAGFGPGRSTIDLVFIVRRVIEIWQRYSKPMQLAFLDFEAAFDSSHLGHLLNALRADGVPGKFVRLLDDMNQRTTAAVRTPAGCTTPFEVVTGVGKGGARTLSVQFRHRRHYANSRPVSCRHCLSTIRVSLD
ncbi:hypothetical protein RB195_023345 [Necator americanus]|uniref:Reverse transcriptase domain-containing protein n=1 Tax=Necator americanus TaxID=51031 RepID=A0ABR1EIS3_NECAM